MGLIRRLATVLMPLAISLSPLSAESPLITKFFPSPEFSRSVIPGSDIISTGINLLPKTAQMQDSPGEPVPYSIGKEVHIVNFKAETSWIPENLSDEVLDSAEQTADLEERTISKELFSASVIASGSLRFPNEQNPEYTTGMELLLRLPINDDYLSGGNRLYFSSGIRWNGSVQTQNIGNIFKDIGQVLPVDSSGLFTGAYIVAKNHYSDQFLILRGGFYNLLNSASEYPHANGSMALEFPSLFGGNFRASPYLGINFDATLGTPDYNLDAELGMRFRGRSEKSMTAYLRAHYNGENRITGSSGIRIEL